MSGVENIMEFDILIKDAKIVDGTGSPWYKGDIGITGDKVNNPPAMQVNFYIKLSTRYRQNYLSRS